MNNIISWDFLITTYSPKIKKTTDVDRMNLSWRPTQQEFSSFSFFLKERQSELNSHFYMVSLEDPAVPDCDAEIIICVEILESSVAGEIYKVYHFILLIKEKLEMRHWCPSAAVVEHVTQCAKDLIDTIKERINPPSVSLDSPGGGSFPLD